MLKQTGRKVSYDVTVVGLISKVQYKRRNKTDVACIHFLKRYNFLIDFQF